MEVTAEVFASFLMLCLYLTHAHPGINTRNHKHQSDLAGTPVFRNTSHQNSNRTEVKAGNSEKSSGAPVPQWDRCCETETTHMALNSTQYRGRIYTVVHLKQEYQFIPIGQCREGTSCTMGACVQRFRMHWILVYDYRPFSAFPFRFITKYVPSFCECLNIGASKSQIS